MKIKNLLMAATTVATLGAIGTVSAQASAASSKPVYRLYNHNTGEHFYTENTYERDSLKRVGWNDEGLGWQAATSGTPVYRVYNPNARGGDHYYTMSKYEAQSLVNVGWRWDNNGKAAFYSGGSVNLYVAYNPNANSGSHNYTINSYEQNSLLGKGWKYGKVAWKTMGASDINNGGNSGGNNNGGNVKPPRPYDDIPGSPFKVDDLISPNAPHKDTIHKLAATARTGVAPVSSQDIAKTTGISSYEGIPNVAGYNGNFNVYLFGAGAATSPENVKGLTAQQAYDQMNNMIGATEFVSPNVLAIKGITPQQWAAVVDFNGYPQNWKSVKAWYWDTNSVLHYY